MLQLPTPHGDKLRALLDNPKLPASDRPRITQAIARYEGLLSQLRQIAGAFKQAVAEMVALLNEYRLYMDVAYVVAECKTNLDKTMFQEAAATALDVKTAVPAAKYYLLCEWLDMTPISTSATAIDEIMILRKCKRLPANIRNQFNTRKGRKNNREIYVNYLQAHPLSADTFARFVSHVYRLFRNDTEDNVLARGYF